jgi:hypothetical protein
LLYRRLRIQAVRGLTPLTTVKDGRWLERVPVEKASAPREAAKATAATAKVFMSQILFEQEEKRF